MAKRSKLDSGERATPSGIPLKPTYASPESPHEAPGEFPFTRGIHADMYRGRLWTFRQYAGFGDATETNRRFRYLLDHGQTGLSVAFDLPTQIGYDSDDAIASGEVGKVGVPISCADDLDELLDGIPLEAVSVSMTINSTAPMLLAFLITVARRRGVDLVALRGTLQNDMLKEFITRRTYRLPMEPSLKLVGDVFEYCQAHMPHWNPISVSGYHMREAGCTAPQELAFTLANAIAYIEMAQRREIQIEQITRRLSFFWNAHNHLFEEIAKFRAARRMWAHIVRDRFAISDPQSARMRFHVQTAGSTLTSREPDNNIVRVTVQALAAILGGTQSLHTNSMDEALGLPTATAARTALRTQQVLAFESGVADVADPLGGAPAIEALTDQVEEAAQRLLAEIDRMGGALQAAAEGFQQRQIEEEAYRHQRAVESGELAVVGVNALNDPSGTDVPPPAQKVNPNLERERIAKLKESKRHRSIADAEAAAERLEAAARADDNLLEPLVECATAGCTIGEMMSRLVNVFGEYRE